MTVPISEFRKNMKEYLLQAERENIYITRNGKTFWKLSYAPEGFAEEGLKQEGKAEKYLEEFFRSTCRYLEDLLILTDNIKTGGRK